MTTRLATPPPLLILILIASSNVVTMNMFLPSLPNMAADFGVSVGVMGWSFSGYLFVIAGMLLIIGPLSDFFGRRPVLIVCFAIYVPASIGCIFAPNIETFFVARFSQAFVVAGMSMAQAIVRDTEENADRAASRLATVVMIMAIMPMMAPLLGGVLADAFGWRSNFVAMGLFGSIVFLLLFFGLEETNLNRSATLGKQLRSIPTLLANARFWGFALTVVANLGVFFVFIIGLPIVGLAEFDMSRTAIGALLAYVPFGYMLGNSVTRIAVKRFGIPALLMSGRVMGVASVLVTFVFLFSGINQPFLLFSPLIFLGVANGLIMATATAGAVSVNPMLAGTAAGLTASLGQSMGAGLTAVSGYILNANPSPVVLLSLMLLVSIFGVIPLVLLHFNPAKEVPSA